jgi:hypothetical protein
MEYKKRILENTHVAVDVKSKKILSMKVTDESRFMIARHYRNWSRIL